MAIFAAAATKAIKSIDEITPGMELWEASWQFRPGYVSETPMFVTGVPMKLGESRFNDTGYTIKNNMYHEYIIPFERWEDRSEEGRIFCADNNIGWGEDASYNDHFLFRSKEDAEEFVKAGAALLETDPNVITAFALQEIEDDLVDDYDDYPDYYDGSALDDPYWSEFA